MTRSRLTFTTSLVAIAAAVAVAVVGAVLLAGGGDDDGAAGGRAGATGRPAGNVPRFELRHPKTWKRVAPRGDATVTIRRAGGTGMVSMTIGGPVEQSLASLRADLQRSLRRRVKGFRLIDSERVRVKAGSALFTSWYAEDSSLVHSNLVVPAGRASFTLDAAVPSGSDRAAEEVGDIFSDFRAEQAR